MMFKCVHLPFNPDENGQYACRAHHEICRKRDCLDYSFPKDRQTHAPDDQPESCVIEQ